MTVDSARTDSPALTRRRLPFPEAAALFNPALGALLITGAAEGYGQDATLGLPWLASFLVTPFVLHDPTRLSLPRDIRTSMASWVTYNPVLRDQFSIHANSLAPATRRGIRYALRAGVLNLSSARLTPLGATRGLSSARGGSIRTYYTASRLVGRWLAQTDVITAYSILGVRL